MLHLVWLGLYRWTSTMRHARDETVARRVKAALRLWRCRARRTASLRLSRLHLVRSRTSRLRAVAWRAWTEQFSSASRLAASYASAARWHRIRARSRAWRAWRMFARRSKVLNACRRLAVLRANRHIKSHSIYLWVGTLQRKRRLLELG